MSEVKNIVDKRKADLNECDKAAAKKRKKKLCSNLPALLQRLRVDS
jgi:hypothetical protein